MGTDVVATVRELASVDLDACDQLEVRRALGLVKRVEAWLASVTAAATRRGAALHAAGMGGDMTAALQREGGLSTRAAHDAVARADALASSTAFSQALAAGSVSAAHVDAFRRAAEHSPVLRKHHDELAVAATRLSPAEFARHCQRVALVNEPEDDGIERFRRQQRATRLKRWVDERTGMYRLYGEFDPETGEKIWAAVDRQVEAMFHDAHPDTAPDDPLARQDHLAGLAVARLVVDGQAAPGTGTRRAEMLVLIDLDTLLRGLHERSVIDLPHGGSLPASVVRRMACDADIIPVVLGGSSVVLDLGRSRRLATPDQRRALLAMYPTCSVPGCTVPYHRCEIHHVGFWARDGGHTDLGAQAPLCRAHHDDVHAERIDLTMHPVTREVGVRARDGTVLAWAPGPPGRARAA